MITGIKYDKATSGRVNLSWMHDNVFNDLSELHPQTASEILEKLVNAQTGKSEARTTQKIIKYIRGRR